MRVVFRIYQNRRRGPKLIIYDSDESRNLEKMRPDYESDDDDEDYVFVNLSKNTESKMT